MGNKRRVWAMIWVILCILMIMSSDITSYAESTNTENEEKLIYFIYDNSISMIRENLGNDKVERKWGAQAQYAVKAFCAMSNPEDEIAFYKVGKREETIYYEKEVINKGEDHIENLEKYIEAIDKIKFDGAYTFDTRIKSVIDEMSPIHFNGEKWIVMFTDGAIEKEKDGKKIGEYTEDEFYNKLKGYMAGTDIKFYFVNINPNHTDIPIQKVTNDNIFWYRMADEAGVSILDSILMVTEEIYGKRRLPDEKIIEEEGKLEISFDIPVSDVMLLLQEAENTDDISWDEYVEGAEWSLILKGEAFGNYDISNDNVDDKSTGPSGILIDCDNFLKWDADQEEHYIELEIPEGVTDYVVYYTPEVATKVSLTPVDNMQSDTVVKEGRYVEGTYNVGVQLWDEEHNLDVSESELLVGETFNIEIDTNKKHDEKIPISEKVDISFLEGTSKISITTSWGTAAELSVKMEDDLEEYSLELKAQDSTFYYNELDKKENGIVVSLKDREGNALEGFSELDIEIEFLNEKGICNEIVCEKEYDNKQDAWIIYPLLKDEKNKDVSGDLSCRVFVTVPSDYYEDPYTYEQELLLHMDVEDESLEFEVPRELEKSRHLLIPFKSVDIPITYKWNGQEVEADEFQTTVQVTYRNGEVDELSFDNRNVNLKGNIKYFWNRPTKIQVTTNAVYTAHGESFETGKKTEEIMVKNPSAKEIILVVLHIIACLLLVIIIGFDIYKLVVWRVREKSFVLTPEVDVGYTDGIAETGKSVKTRYERFLWVFLKGYYTEIVLDVQGKKVMLQVRTEGDNYELCLVEDGLDRVLTVGGQKVLSEWLIFDKTSSECLLEVPEVGTMKILIHFGGKR